MINKSINPEPMGYVVQYNFHFYESKGLVSFESGIWAHEIFCTNTYELIQILKLSIKGNIDIMKIETLRGKQYSEFAEQHENETLKQCLEILEQENKEMMTNDH